MDLKFAFKNAMKAKRKEIKKAKTAKRAKIIVHNLPFTTTEENLREHFQIYGDIESVNILKKPDGNLIGCAFVQYKLVQSAKMAHHYLDGKPFLEREIEVAFAIAKDKYQSNKREAKSFETVGIEGEFVKEIDTSTVKIEDGTKESVENVDDDSNSDRKDNFDDEDESLQVKCEEETKKEKRSRVFSNDVLEGKTVFVKNVPFAATNDDLKECMSQFGPTIYSLICIDQFTEHSKGTAFVKFKVKFCQF